MILPEAIYQRWPLTYLRQLSSTGDIIIIAAIACHCVYLTGSFLSNRFNEYYRKLNYGKQASWSIHIVSFVFSSFIIPACIPIYYIKENQMDRLLGSSDYSRSIFGIASGYFLWDLIISVYHFAETGPAFVFHASACLVVFAIGLMPFAQGHGPVFLLFETSTIFLNIHWFCDKTGRSGTRLQWINGMCLLVTFFFSRLVNGTWGMAIFVNECFTRKDELPFGLIMFYTLAAAGLGSLNFYWFSLMIRSVTSRFKERRPNPPSAFANQAPSKEKEKKKELKRD